MHIQTLVYCCCYKIDLTYLKRPVEIVQITGRGTFIGSPSKSIFAILADEEALQLDEGNKARVMMGDSMKTL